MKRWVLGSAALVLLLPGLIAVWLTMVVTPQVRADLVTSLAQGYGHTVVLGALHWRLLPQFQLRGEHLHVGGDAGAGVPPLITVDRFEVEASLRALLSRPRQIRAVRLRGLRVHVPPAPAPHAGSDAPTDPAGADAASVDSGRAAVADPAAAEAIAGSPPDASPVTVGEVVAEDALIEIAPSRPDRTARVYTIHDLRLTGLATDRAVGFEAALINPHPEGDVITSGSFGPWNRAAGRATPVAGRYRFEQADLAAFRGIGGVLASTGAFEGTLGDLVVKGEADIPDFVVAPANQPVALQTSFDVEISDKGGDLQLRPVRVRFEESEMIAEGEIVRRPDGSGRTILLDVTGEGARVEDLLKFALVSPVPPLTGTIDLKVRLEIPPGDPPVIEKMRLEGEFTIRRARFTDLNVQSTLDRVSRLTRGEVAGDRGGSTVSNLQGEFTLAGAVLTFSRLSFSVPGTRVQLAGRVGLLDEQMDLRGRVLLDRPPSEMVSGRAGRWLRFVDPVVGSGEARSGRSSHDHRFA